MRRRAIAAGVAAVSLAGGGAAAAMDGMPSSAPGAHVSIGYQAYDPSKVEALAGDTVTWQNQSPRGHTVTSEDLSWSSGTLYSTGTFAHRFDSPGTFDYFCMIHPGMRGEVDVYSLLLDSPTQVVAPGQHTMLHGRAALPQGSSVSIEADSGSGYRPVTSATVGSDGGFDADLAPRDSASYRAVAGDAASPAVSLRVVDRKVHASAARHGTTAVVSALVAPRAPGSTVVLQVHSRERFGWWPTRFARLGRSSRAQFTLRTRHRLTVRVALTLRDGATVLALGPKLRVPADRRRRG